MKVIRVPYLPGYPLSLSEVLHSELSRFAYLQILQHLALRIHREVELREQGHAPPVLGILLQHLPGANHHLLKVIDLHQACAELELGVHFHIRELGWLEQLDET